MYETRVLSGMRPTGSLHLGHYHGVLKNWVRLQAEYPCLFFVADWHALTTDYEKPGDVQQTGLDMVIDWLAAGVDPNQAILFDPCKFLKEQEPHLPGTHLPSDWSVTSDSISARIAEVLQADELVLLKSADPSARSWSNLAAAGYVDWFFRAFDGSGFQTRVINLRSVLNA